MGARGVDPADLSLRLSIEDDPSQDDLATVRQRLTEYNRGYAADDGYRPLAVFLRDEAGTIVAGLTGGTFWDWLWVDLFWVQEDLRGRGIGGRMLRSAEEEAIRRGCIGAFLDTHSFQSLAFYQQRGYSVVGELPDMPPGHVRYYLAKRFGVESASDG